ncbi:AAA family ATPase [Vibrio diabolicus]|uniref:AAA family ATPase n=1 Tax=Vibrio diabolicus TaxID=50719 RepID=UPI003750B470|nr:AAA family ATPase [Vibrio parahaemolyticus]HBN6313595.1 AAA family ATPase [Vibrio parahaemolyticus]HCG7068013.1 AAA family ATPase [Vibrio parahaemolyticus]
MSFLVNKLLFPSDFYPEAEIDFSCKDHLVFGPTDTGKTYVVEAIKFILGGKAKYLRDIGYNERYEQIALQVCLRGEPYTIFRDLSGKRHDIYPGHIKSRPKSGKVKGTVSKFIIDSTNSNDYKILIKSGVLGDLTTGDLRRVSLFSENDTLSLDSFEGSDSNTLVRNRASLSLFLTGKDDKNISLVLSTDERNEAKGRASFIEEQMLEIKERLPDKVFSMDLKEEVFKLDNEIERLNNLEEEINIQLLGNREGFFETQKNRDRKNKELSHRVECKINFETLRSKLNNDFDRLTTLSTFSDISKHFQRSSCPVCDNHIENEDGALSISLAAKVESDKIKYHLSQIDLSIKDIICEIDDINGELNSLITEIDYLESEYEELSSKYKCSVKDKLMELYDLRTDLIQWNRDKEQYLKLDMKLVDNKEKSKQKKQEVDRNIEDESKDIIERVSSLLNEWGVPDIKSVGFNKEVVDLTINGRERKSYGKGKRGIFLSAYVIALMELALKKQTPHLGFVVIDSPVVTYKDPKHSKNATKDDELLDITVKDGFYKWLFERNGSGQVVVLENEEPQSKWTIYGKHTEFTGEESSGRQGLFPIGRV